MAASHSRAEASSLAVTTVLPSGPEHGGVDPVRMALELAQLLAGSGVPQADGVVVAGGDDHLTVGTESGGVDRVGMARKHLDLLESRHIPQAGGAVAAGSQDGAAIRAEDRGVNSACVLMLRQVQSPWRCSIDRGLQRSFRIDRDQLVGSPCCQHGLPSEKQGQVA